MKSITTFIGIISASLFLRKQGSTYVRGSLNPSFHGNCTVRKPFRGFTIIRDHWLQLILAILLFAPAVALAQEGPGTAPRRDPRQVFAEIMKPYRNLNDYTVKIHAKINMPTIRVPDFTATLYFKKPDRFHIETKSFAPLPRNSGTFNPFQFDPEKNQITFQRTENLGGTQVDLYRVEPLDTKTLVRYYNVWVEGGPGRILQVESLTFRGTKGLVTLSYRTVAKGLDKWLMPENIRIHLTFPEGAPNLDASSLITKDNPVSGGMRRLDEVAGEGVINLSYIDWQINTGLDDSLFKNDRNN